MNTPGGKTTNQEARPLFPRTIHCTTCHPPESAWVPPPPAENPKARKADTHRGWECKEFALQRQLPAQQQ